MVRPLRMLAPGLLVALLAAFALGACLADDADIDGVGGSNPTFAVANVAALTQLANGDVVAADRTGSVLYRIDVDTNTIEPLPVKLSAATVGQRGLLGLASDTSGRMFLAWTRPDERLVVSEIVDGSEVRDVWEGFASSTGANGGHLAMLDDETLVIGIGTLRRSALIDDPAAINGKMLALNPNGPPNQVPEVLSSGWRNPFAFTVADGALWVADNETDSADRGAERLGRGDPQTELGIAPSLVVIEDPIAPAALIHLGDERLGVCGYLTGTLQEVTLAAGMPSQPGRVLAEGCRTAALVLADGGILVSDGQQLTLIDRDGD